MKLSSLGGSWEDPPLTVQKRSSVLCSHIVILSRAMSNVVSPAHLTKVFTSIRKQGERKKWLAKLCFLQRQAKELFLRVLGFIKQKKNLIYQIILKPKMKREWLVTNTHRPTEDTVGIKKLCVFVYNTHTKRIRLLEAGGWHFMDNHQFTREECQQQPLLKVFDNKRINWRDTRLRLPPTRSIFSSLCSGFSLLASFPQTPLSRSPCVCAAPWKGSSGSFRFCFSPAFLVGGCGFGALHENLSHSSPPGFCLRSRDFPILFSYLCRCLFCSWALFCSPGSSVCCSPQNCLALKVYTSPYLCPCYHDCWSVRRKVSPSSLPPLRSHCC